MVIDKPLPKKSVATFEQVLTINREQLQNKIGSLSEKLMQAANRKLEIAFGLIPQFA